MIVCPHNQDDAWFIDACSEHFMTLWDRKKMCAHSKRFPRPKLAVVVEVRDLEGNYVGHTTYHRACYRNQGEAFDRDNRIVILWRGWEFVI